MSYEFGWCGSGYVYDVIRQARDYCRDGDYGKPAATTQMFGRLLDPLVDVARHVCAQEACDSGADAPVNAMIAAIPQLRSALAELEEQLDPYRQVADAAVRQYIRDQEAQGT